MENLMENMFLSTGEDDDLVIDLDDVEENVDNIELCLVGKFLTDQTTNFNILRSRMANVWRPKKGVTIKEIGKGRILCQFYHNLDLKRVMDGGPWTFGNHPLLIHKLKLGENLMSVPLHHLPFWVRVHNVPAGFFSERVGRMLGNFIGKFMEYDGSNKGSVWLKFMWIRVEIDTNLPLKRWKYLRLATGTSEKVTFQYERLSLFCFCCGKLDHTESFCDLVFDSAGGEVKKEWGPELKVTEWGGRNTYDDKYLRGEADAGKFAGAGSSIQKTDARDVNPLIVVGTKGVDDPSVVKWVKWDMLCKHKNEGGMGFRNLHLFNIAMLGKLVWRIKANPELLIARVLKAKYFSNTDVFEAILGSSPSYVWRNIHAAIDLVRMGTRWRVGDGSTVRIWGDPWLESDQSFYISTPVEPGFEDMVVGDLYVPGTRQWHPEVVDEAFNEVDRYSIMRTTPAPHCNVDKLVWHHSPKGDYTVKTAYHLASRLVEGVHVYEETPWKRIWRVKIPPKVRSFYWHLCKGWISVRTKLRKWFNTMDTLCPVCGQMPESVWHLFVDCAHARACWAAGNLWHKIDELCYMVEDSSELFLSIMSRLEGDELVRAMMIVWALWRGRNSVVWNDVRDSPTRQVFAAMTTLVEWQAAQPITGVRARGVCCRKWHAPVLGYVKINVDAAFFEDSLEAGLGMIVHDDLGDFICCRSLIRSGLLKVDEGEVWGIVKAIRWAIHLGLERVIVESDAKRVVDAFKKGNEEDTILGDFMGEGRRLLEAQEHYSISWACRNVNTVAHFIARTSRNYDSPHCWVEPSVFVDDLLDRCTSCV